MEAIVFGDGPLGVAIADEVRARGHDARVVGRPSLGGVHAPAALTGADLAFEASRGGAVLPNVGAALEVGCRRFVIATTGWEADRSRVAAALERAGAVAVAAPNFSVGAALFLRLVANAATLFGAVPAFEPFVAEWHRRDKRDRPSGTARELARLIAASQRSAGSGEPIEVSSVRAGSSPGAHQVAFDAPGETIELRLTARDRSAYAAGAWIAAEWLRDAARTAGIHPWDAVVDDLLTLPATASAPA